MPFTLSHPAAVLVLLRRAGERGPLVATALVAGSMAPDVPFFAESLLPGVYRHGGPTHRWWAAPTLDVALTAALAAGWHLLWRGPVAALLPAGWIPAAAGDGPPRPGPFALSAAIGAAGHLGWDSFTHRDRAGVRLLPVLNRRVAGVPLYTALQYGSSLAGLAVLARYAAAGAGSAAAASTASPAVPAAERAAVRRMAWAAAAAGAAHRLARRRGGRIDELCFGAGAGLAVGLAAWTLLRGAGAGRAR
ncbi:DUF4184 family protein [Kitasatospora sp. NPDC048540]|uniref:DUF4184 family protein n=2 Tax=unclassified Kitasatospora TaxID=2633591 RepID=UPI0033DAF6DC